MKTFKDPHDGKPFLAQLIDGPGKGCTLSFFEVAGPGTKSFFVPRNKVAEARRAYNRPHLPEMLLSFAEGLLLEPDEDHVASMVSPEPAASRWPS